MSDETVYNLLRGTSAQAQTSTGYAAFKFALTKALEVGKTYTFSVDVDELSSSATDSPYIGPNDGNGHVRYCTLRGTGHKVGTFTVGNLNYDESVYDFASFAIYNTPGLAGSLSATKRLVIRNAMLVEGDTPAAWAPADGEELAGVGAQMSANLWTTHTNIQQNADGTYTMGAKGSSELQAKTPGMAAVTENQTVHMGASLRGSDSGSCQPYVEYKNAAGNLNWVGFPMWTPTADWQRFEGSCVVSSGMTIIALGFNNNRTTGKIKIANPVFSYGPRGPILASDSHTPYATQDHVAAEYATKAALKVTDDSVKAEVSARAQTDRNVADLSSRLTQTANSLTSEISDRRTAITTVTGLANAAQSTADTAKTNASTAQHTADNAAKQANLYTIGLGDAGAVAKWIHLGTLTSAGNSSSATIAIVFGNGYNGFASQNSKLTITIKDGFQSTGSATKACGVSVMRENCDNALVDVLAQSATVYDVWVYVPWAHSEGRYSISGQYAAWQHSGATQKAEPATSATQVKQDVAYRLADATKAQTMATENQSSIKQLSTSITSEVKARAKTDGAVSELSSKMEQTVNGINVSLDKLTATERQIHSWFDFGSDASGNPKLAMGSSTSPIVGEYSNTGATYKDRSGATLLALDAANSTTGADHVVSNDVTIGKWQWVPTNNGTHLTLMWRG